MADEKYIYQAQALMKFFCKRGLTDLSTIEAVLDDNYDESITKYIKDNMMTWRKKYRNGDADLSDLFRYKKMNDIFITFKSNRRPKKISYFTKKPYSEISLENHGALTYECVVPYIISEELKKARLQFCKDFLDTANTDQFKFLSTIIMGTAVWLPYKCEEILSSTSEKNKYLYETKPNGEKTMFFCFFDSLDIIYHKFVPMTASNVMRDSFYYVEVLQEFWQHLQKTRLEYKKTDNWCLMLENIMPYNSAAVKAYLAKNQICLIEYPPFSPDLSMCEDLLFNQDAPCLYGMPESKKIIVDYERYRANKASTAIFHYLMRLYECIKLKGSYVIHIDYN